MPSCVAKQPGPPVLGRHVGAPPWDKHTIDFVGADADVAAGGRGSRPHSDVSSVSDDLEVVCLDHPVLTPDLPPQRMLKAVKSLGSMVRRVGSKVSLYEAGVSSQECHAASSQRADDLHAGGLSDIQTSPAWFDTESAVHPDSCEVSNVARGARRRRSTSEQTSLIAAKVPQAAWDRRGLCLKVSTQDTTTINSVPSVMGPQMVATTMPKSTSAVSSRVSCIGSCESESPRDSLPSSGSSDQVTMQELGLPLWLRRSDNSVGSLVNLTLALEQQSTPRSSILDFEHLFVQYYVAFEPERRRLRDVLAMCRHRAVDTCPITAEDVVEEWKTHTVEYIWANQELCQRRWPELRLSRRALERQLNNELKCNDELAGPHGRILLTLQPERVCHRLLWAIGDENPPGQFLHFVQGRMRRRWPRKSIRCADSVLFSPSIFRTLFIVATILFVLSLKTFLDAAEQAWSQTPDGKKGGPTRDELLDQLCARLLLAGGMAHLWLLSIIAAAFPLRSLHSPFRRDPGCIAAYSSTALFACRVVGPLAAMAMPVAMAIRFERLGLLQLTLKCRAANWPQIAALLGAMSKPLMTLVVAWSVRSSMYTLHHFFIGLLAGVHLGSVLGFAAYFEVVQWAVFAATAGLLINLFLFTRYTAEFNHVSLLKAAHLHWAGAVTLPVLWIVLAAALEVESGFARTLVDFICDNQDVMPPQLCRHLLRNANK